MNNIDIIDNVLDPIELKELQYQLIESNNFPWYYSPFSVSAGDGQYQFTHLFYVPNEGKVSSYCHLLNKLNNIIKPSCLVRIKANLNTKTESNLVKNFHTDYDYPTLKTSIFYVNSNNGTTIFKDGTSIQSIENRLVTFNSNLLHTGTTCTDENVRVLINFNYFD